MFEKIVEALTTKVPLGKGVEIFVDFLTTYCAGVFKAISKVVLTLIASFDTALITLPALLFIFVMAALLAWVRTWKHGVFAGLSLLLLFNLGMWEETMMTLALVLSAATISILLGLPVGILCAHNKMAYTLTRPILDFMQTIPPFVYLIPAMMFFGLGKVPAVVATVIFAAPPPIRLTYLGIKGIPGELIEAGEAFGSNRWQMLSKVELPNALPSIMVGVNQCIMMSLSMMVIAAMIGAKGLGQEVLRSLSWIDVGMGFEAGIGIVILAIVIDRLVTG